tara:strand:- start:112 stop:741 length:630 start_codon:yes stop_codon:yes gene_type:complete
VGKGGRRIKMSQKLKLLFPTPLVKTNIGTDFDISNIEFERNLGNNGWVSVDQYYLDNNKKLKDSIEKEIEIYFRETLKVKKNVYLKHQTSWVMLHKRGDASPRHYHTNSWLSGVYYFNQFKNSGAVQFHAQRPYGWSCSSMNPIQALEEITDITSGTYVINPREGDLLLFPSQLEHSSFPNNTDEDRVVISFNYTLHGTWGPDTGRITI